MRGIGRIAAASLVWLWVVAGSQIARAQTIEGEEMNAQQAYKRGVEHYDNGEFEKAAEYFRYAVDKKSHPVLHFNLSQAYLELGQLEKALEQAEIADRKGPLGESASAANRATLAAGGIVERARSWEPPPPPSSDTTDTGPPDPHEMVDESSLMLSPLGWAGIGGIGAGLGLTAGAAAIDNGLTGDFQARREAHRAGNPARVGELNARIQSKQTAGRILLFSGIGLAAAGGGVLAYDLVWNRPKSRSAEIRGYLIPSPGGHTAGLRVSF